MNLENIIKILEKLSKEGAMSKHEIFMQVSNISYATLYKYENFLLKHKFITIEEIGNKKLWVMTEKGKTFLNLLKHER